jgi:hypothetical protein
MLTASFLGSYPQITNLENYAYLADCQRVITKSQPGVDKCGVLWIT